MTHPIRRLFWGEIDPYEGFRCTYDKPLDLQGFDVKNARIRSEIEKHKPKTVLEIGAFKGASAIWMAECAPEAHILTIDPWCLPDDYFGTQARLQRFAFAKDYFRACVVSHGLDERITYLPMLSDEAIRLLDARAPDLRFDLAYIDGDHRYDACLRDLRNYAPRTRGPVIVDDYEPNWPEVVRAVDDYAASRDARVEKDGRKALLIF